MSKSICALLALFLSFNAFSQSFTSIWNTNNTSPQSPANDEITIPTNPTYTNYNYTVDWGDTNTDTNVTGDITHTYASPGTYTISISGDFPAIYFNNENTSDKLKIIEILDWGTIQWQSMENAFYGCLNLNFDAISSPDLSQVTSLQNMFRDCHSFNGIMNNWDISTITNISGIFAETDIFNRPLDNWSTSNITDMSYAFYRARQFNEPLDNWNTSSVTTMEYLFSEASQFDQNINNWNVILVTNMSGTFRYANNYNKPLNNWVVDNVTNMSSMFAGSSFNFPIENWNVDNVTDMSYMFYQASQFNQPLQGWKVSQVTDMNNMFARTPAFNQPLNGWNTSNVTNMAGMFDGWPTNNTIFNQPLNDWDVSNVTDMSYMFRYSKEFNQPLNNWIVDNVTDMEHMFERTIVFNQDISGWNVDLVTNMGSMFQGTSAFNQNINGWNVGNVTDMNAMFYLAQVFNQPLNGWNVSKVTNMSSMFRQTPVFNQPLDNWNTGEVTTMTQIFNSASSFDQNLATWDISKVTNITLSNSAISQENYDNILIGWAAQTVRNDVILGATNLNYCDGLDARQELIDNSNWNIIEDIVNCSFVLCTQIISPFDGDTNVPANSDIVWNVTPNATGYRVSIRREDDDGNILQIVFDNQDLGNTTRVTFTNEFFPGDNVFVTVVPYNDEGPATDCQELYFRTVPSWVNSPDAFKLTYDTTLLENGTTNANQLKIETNTGYPGYFDYDYSIDWGDNEYNNNVTGDITHTYAIPGVYTISIIGDFPAPLHDYSNTDAIKLLSIDQWGTQVWQSLERAFYYCENMEYNATDIPNLSNVINMSNTFAGCYLFDGNMNSWDVSNVTNMSYMLIGAIAFNQPLDQWDVSQVENMSGMLFACDAFNQPIGNWITSSLLNTSRMFNGAELFNQPLNSWDMSKVVNTYQMFANTDNFNQPLDNWNVSQVTDMSEMFYRASAFNEPIELWNVGNVTNMEEMFGFTEVFNQPLNQWNVSSVTNMNSMFRSSEEFDQPLSNWDVSLVVNMASMFSNAEMFNQNINSWNVTNVTNMSSMFSGAEVYNQPMNSWDVNSVVNMSYMFSSAEAFNQPLNSWNVSAVANMSSMFENAVLFNQSLNSWDVSSVTLMNSMFEEATVFDNLIRNWNVGSVTNMEAMFKDAAAFNQDIQNWDTGEVLTMEEMFSGATLFDQNLDSWNTSFVTTMEAMFENATAFNQTLNSWNVASVTTMESMFQNATGFNGTIDNWNVRGVLTMESMFEGATVFNQTINNWRVPDVQTMEAMFRNATTYNQTMDQWILGEINMEAMFDNASALNQYLGDWDISNVTNMTDMLDNTSLVRENYDNTLIAWSEQTLTNGITLGAEGLPYCDALEERQSIIDSFSWNIQQDVLDCPVPECTQLSSPLNGAIDVPINTNLTWESVLFARGYRLTVGTSSGASDIVDNETINNSTTYEFAANFIGGETVFVTIIPFNDEGDAIGPCAEESFTISASPATIPDCTFLSSPLNGDIEVVIDTDLTWEPISNADGYNISVGTSSGATDILNNEDVANMTTFDLALDLPEDTEIFVTLTPYNDVGYAVACIEESFTTELIPVPPACTSIISPANNDINVLIDTNLSWNPIDNATGYLVVVGNTQGGIEIANNIDVGNTTTYDFPDDLQENRTHYVTIIPYNAVGDAIACSEQNFRTGNSTLNDPPSCTTLSMPLNGDSNIALDADISWNAIPNTDGYRLTVGTTTGGTNILNNVDVGNVLTYDLPANLPENSAIFVSVIPYNSFGNASGCNDESFTTEFVVTAPTCTSLSSPLNGGNNISISSDLIWNAVADADGYRLTIGTTNGGNDILADADLGNVLTYNPPVDFNENTEIFVTITPYNATGSASGCIEESFITETVATVPSCTTLLSPLDNSESISISTSLNWNASTSADGYLLTVGTISGGNDILDSFDVGDVLAYDLPNDLPENTQIFVTIVPYNGVGDATGCSEESFITETIGSIPECTTLSSALTNATAVSVSSDLTWNAINNADGYRLIVGTTSGENDILASLDVGNVLTYDLPNELPFEQEIFVTIIPYNTFGDATGCGEQSFITVSEPMPPACTNLLTPLNLDLEVSVSVILSWNAANEADGYRLTVGTASGLGDILNNENIGNLTSYNLPNDLPENTEIFVSIVPYNDVGDADFCEEESFITETLAPNTPPCTIINSPENGSIDVPVGTEISWNAVGDIQGYIINIGTTIEETDILNNFDVGLTTSYDLLEDLPFNQEIFISVLPYNEEGIAVDCDIHSFTTITEPEVESLYGFSPDNDGINDFWVIEGIEQYPENTVLIFNRWGDKVFQINGYDNNSNVFSGEANQMTGFGAGELPEGTYFFQLILPDNHNLKQTKGFLVLKR